MSGVFTSAEPLGPVDHAMINKYDTVKILNHKVEPFVEALAKSAILIYGRKGAGKSALLTELQTKALNNPATLVRPEKLPPPQEPFILSVLSWQQFARMIQAVSARFSVNEIFQDIVPVEEVASLWYEVIWDSIIQFFYDFAHFDETRAALNDVANYVNGIGGTGENAIKEAAALFDSARRQILNLLDSRRSEMYLLFDSMENYPVKNIAFSMVLCGFFQALRKVNYEAPLINITFCIPEEIEPFLNANSSNVLKDFSSSHRIQWRPIDLLRIVAHRYRLCVQEHDEQYFKEIERLEFDERNDLHRLFSRMLPEEITNGLKEPEDTLAYILRHTQLLPRHIIAIFNKILSRGFAASGGFRSIQDAAVLEGIAEVEGMIAEQILIPYQRIYPNLIESCTAILPELDPICSYADLQKIESRFKNRVDEGCIDIWQTLYEMGVMGKVLPSADTEKPRFIRSNRYCLGEFKFNSNTARLGLAHDAEYCFHPVFSKYFNMRRRDLDDKRAIYPAGVDIVALMDA